MGGKKRQEGRQPAAKPLLENNVDSKFARALGSTDFHTREAGLQAVTAWMARRPDMEELEMLKLWRAVFYAFWHSDKAHVQVRGGLRWLPPAGALACQRRLRNVNA